MVDDKWIGLALAVSSSAAIGVSSIITKKGLNASADTTYGSSASDNMTYLKNPIWWAGMSTPANFAAYTFAPPILVTPLGALSVLIGAVLASFLLGERLGHLGRLGCTLSLIGSLIIVLHAPEDKAVETVDEILGYAVQPGFLLYVLTVIVFTLVMIYVAVPRYGRSNPLVYISICSVVGSVSVMSIKGFGVAVKLTFGGNNQFLRPSTYAFGLVSAFCIMVQMNYLNKSLDTFSVNIVNPMYYVGFSSSTIVASLILFQGFNTTDATNTISLISGFIVIFLGVHLLNLSRNQGPSVELTGYSASEDAPGHLGRLSIDGWHGIVTGPEGIIPRPGQRSRNQTTTLFDAFDDGHAAEHVGLERLREEDETEDDDDDDGAIDERTRLRSQSKHSSRAASPREV
ncbi:DUF803-domain-containing protein [Guyanagaster necrorhizus]|uniref:DUF803-domain-containing protein n=1 Tax=Guyanagaster necrorhizus TaxID=856835 RepID=A0A9P8AN11_9AGAR|nr:DUF803-domain-containing protein [Guyanagaster necrorhizus MCA 3950]KAG7441334.1 DUF803-domain-containing protein [Guyanagaster necrorhizus MCA 3950]